MQPEHDRPRLRLVEDAPPQPASPPTASPSTVLAPLPAQSDLQTAILAADLSRPRVAFRLAWAARTLVGAALDTRRAAASAAPHLHVRGRTPGERSTEAAEAVARAHLAEAVAGRTREAELRQMGLRAVEEVASARQIARESGLDADEALSGHLREAAANLLSACEPEPRAVGLVRVGEAPVAIASARGGRGLGDLLAALFGGVLLGLLLGRVFKTPSALPPPR